MLKNRLFKELIIQGAPRFKAVELRFKRGACFTLLSQAMIYVYMYKSDKC